MKKGILKKIAVLATVGIMTFTTATAAFANDGSAMATKNYTYSDDYGQAMVIDTKGVDVYSSVDSSEAKVINHLDLGDAVLVNAKDVLLDGKKTGWSRIQTENKKDGGECDGYVKTTELSQVEDVDIFSEFAEWNVVKTDKGTLEVKATNEDNAKTVGTISNGDYFIVTNPSGGSVWYGYAPSLGAYGYVDANGLEAVNLNE